MDAEYGKLALRIAAAYPSSFISDATLADWTERLFESDDLEHAHRVMRRLINLPSPPDPYDWRNARRDSREVEIVRALPSGPIEPAEMDDETRERWEALKAKLRERPIGRPIPTESQVPDDELEPKFVLRRDMLCGGTGKALVKINGKLCCPDCKEPLPEDESEFASMRRENSKSRR